MKVRFYYPIGERTGRLHVRMKIGEVKESKFKKMV